MTVSLAAVFIPILFMSGILGRLFREFAVTITAAILVSGLVSVTLTPMLCSRFLKTAALHDERRLSHALEAVFRAMFRAYEWSLGLALRRRAVMLVVFATKVNWHDTWRAIKSASPSLLLLAALVNLASLGLKGVRWWIFLCANLTSRIRH